MSEAFRKLKERFEPVRGIFGAIGTILEDTNVRMPEGSIEDRTVQFTALAVAHAYMAGLPELKPLLMAADKDKTLTPHEREQLAGMANMWQLENQKPRDSSEGPYQKLYDRFRIIRNLDNAVGIINMVSQTTNPTDAQAEAYAHQAVAVSKAAHSLISAPLTAEWLDKAEQDKASLSKGHQKNLELMRKAWVHRAALPVEMASELTRIELEVEREHTKFRDTGDWSKMRDAYAHAFEIRRTVGDLKKGKLGVATAYEALMDEYMPGIARQEVESNLKLLQKALPALIQETVDKQGWETAPVPLSGTFTREQQTELSRRLIGALGFDFSRGLMEVVDGHPQTMGTADDTRFTTDYNVKNFMMPNVYSTVHEAGHAMYYQGAPKEWRYQPAGECLGMDVHEAMSRIIEMQACRTPQFFRYLEKEAREVFGRPDDPALDAKNLERLINRVEPSFIRVDADEMTYPAHIILRHRIEQDMFDNKMTVDDIPKKWNEGMKELLGVEVTSNAHGCMQDVHWPVAYIGYFPAYTMGDMRAAQYFAKATKDNPAILDGIEQGNFKPLHTWLEKNVYSKGSLMTARELDIAVTGEPLNAKYYLEHLSRRYLGRSYQPFAAPRASAGLRM